MEQSVESKDLRDDLSDQAGTPERQTVPLPIPTDVRNLSLLVLAVLASVLALHLAQSVFIPIVFGILIGYALDPIVSWLGRWKIPRPISAAVLLLALVAAFGSSVYSLRDDAAAIVDNLPLAAQNLRERLREIRLKGPGPVEKMQQAAKEIEKAAAEASGSKPQPRSVPQAPPPLDLSQYVWSGSLGVVTLLGQSVLVLFLVYFILASGDLYKRKLVKIAGPTLSEKRVRVEILDDINRQIERFLFVQLFTSIIAALLTWAACAAMGLQYAAVWGIAAGIGNFIPYVGPIVVAGLITIAGFLQFETLSMAALIGSISLVIKGFVGFLLTPWLMSRAAKMNPVALFVGLLFWGWIWGIWGMMLAMPMIMVVKFVCDHIHDLKGIGELLGE